LESLATSAEEYEVMYSMVVVSELCPSVRARRATSPPCVRNWTA